MSKISAEILTLDSIDSLNVTLPSGIDYIEISNAQAKEILDDMSVNPEAHEKQKKVNKTSVKRNKKHQEKRKKQQETGEYTYELSSFDDIIQKYNLDLGLTIDEIKCYVWYMNSIGQPMGGEWKKYLIDTDNDFEVLIDWMNKGILAYGYVRSIFGISEKPQFIPKFIYYSGNLYDRELELNDKGEVDEDGRESNKYGLKQEITSKFGAEYFETLVAGLKEAFLQKEINSPKLRLNDVREKRIKIKPISEFANDTNFDITSIFLNGEEDLSQINYQTDGSLTGAFIRWLYDSRNFPETPNMSTPRQIIDYYLNNKNLSRVTDDKEAQEEMWAEMVEDGDYLFSEFLATGLQAHERVIVESIWNKQFNADKDVDLSKIPIGFVCNKNFKDGNLEIRVPTQRNGIAAGSFNPNYLLAYDTGVGKTLTGILTIAQKMQAEQIRRPLLVVPDVVYEKWKEEIGGNWNKDKNAFIEGLLPQYQINDFRNFNKDVRAAQKNKLYKQSNGKWTELPEDSITIINYAGLMELKFRDETKQGVLTEALGKIYQANIENLPPKQKYRREIDMEILLGERTKGFLTPTEKWLKEKPLEAPPVSDDKAWEVIFEKITTEKKKEQDKIKGNYIYIEDLGFDYIMIDEAHNFNHIFDSIKADSGTTSDRSKKNIYDYKQDSSVSAQKLYLVVKYIQSKNKQHGNVLMLTATPFTNNPLEIYSMLSMLGQDYLDFIGIKNVKRFFDTYAKVERQLVEDRYGSSKWDDIFTGFNNLKSLQTIIFKYMDFKTGDDAAAEDSNFIRPTKWILPFTKGRDDEGNVIDLPADKRVESRFPLNQTQKNYYDLIRQYADKKITYSDLVGDEMAAEYEVKRKKRQELLIRKYGNDRAMSMMNRSDMSARALRYIRYARAITVSPYMFIGNDLPKLDFSSDEAKKESAIRIVNTSPKLKYTMDCIKSILKHHKDNNQHIGNVIIYAEQFNFPKNVTNLNLFDILKIYAVNELGYKESEVDSITGKDNDAEKKFEKVNAFNSGRIKLLFGSDAIKEGVDLQIRTSTLFDIYLTWNPTDIKQLEGRVHRFLNSFDNVRIVYPLCEDSIDIFMFQKLQEKLSRITEITTRNYDANEMEVGEIDPEEQKLALITEPEKIAARENELYTKEQNRKIKRVGEYLDQLNSYQMTIAQYDDVKHVIVDADNEYERLKQDTRDTKKRKKIQEKAEKRDAALNRKKNQQEKKKEELSKYLEKQLEKIEADKTKWLHDEADKFDAAEEKGKEYIVKPFPKKERMAELDNITKEKEKNLAVELEFEMAEFEKKQIEVMASVEADLKALEEEALEYEKTRKPSNEKTDKELLKNVANFIDGDSYKIDFYTQDNKHIMGGTLSRAMETFRQQYALYQQAKDFLAGRGKDVTDDLAPLKADFETDLKMLQEDLLNKTSVEALTIRTEAIRKEREEMKRTSKSVEERVLEFETTNYLLNELRKPFVEVTESMGKEIADEMTDAEVEDITDAVVETLESDETIKHPESIEKKHKGRPSKKEKSEPETKVAAPAVTEAQIEKVYEKEKNEDQVAFMARLKAKAKLANQLIQARQRIAEWKNKNKKTTKK